MITADEVKKIALLARIGLQEDEISKHQKSLSEILEYFEQLRTVSLEETDSFGSMNALRNIYRSDTVLEQGEQTRKQILENAPEQKEGFLQVKSVF